MRDEIKEQISALVDSETYDQDIIDQVKHDDELRATMTRYSLVGDVLNNRYEPGSHELAAKVSDSLHDEATLITPQQWLKKPRLMKQTAGIALAATVAAIAILVAGNFSATTNTQTTVTVVVGPITDKPVRMTSAVQRKLNGYLVSHTEYSASSQMKGMLPYTRIASFAPGQRVATQIESGATLEE